MTIPNGRRYGRPSLHQSPSGFVSPVITSLILLGQWDLGLKDVSSVDGPVRLAQENAAQYHQVGPAVSDDLLGQLGHSKELRI